MADPQHPSGITLDLFHRDGLLSMVQNGTTELSKATSTDMQHQVIDSVIANLTFLANLGRTELDRLRTKNLGPINQDEILHLLSEFDLAIQEWQLVRQRLHKKSTPETFSKHGNPPKRPRISEVDILRMGPTLTKNDVAAISGYSVSWIEKNTAKNRIPGVRRAVNGRHVIYDTAVIVQWYRDSFPLLPER